MYAQCMMPVNTYPVGVIRAIGRPEGQLEEFGGRNRISGGDNFDRFVRGGRFPRYV